MDEKARGFAGAANQWDTHTGAWSGDIDGSVRQRNGKMEFQRQKLFF